MARHAVPTPRRRGLTLTELLIVVAILVILMAVMVPALGVVTKGRDVRESARQLSTFLAQAQTRAIELGRPVGVWFERDQNNPNAAWQLYQAEVPPAYGGDTYHSLARIELPSGMVPGKPVTFNVYFHAPMDLQLTKPGFVNKGDSIRFAHRGPWYEVFTPPVVTGNNILMVCTPSATSLQLSNVAQLPAPTAQPGTFSGAGVAYEILRRPRRIGTKVLTLATNTAVDLFWSGGKDLNSLGLPPYTDFRSVVAASTVKQPELVVMFDSKGRMARYYAAGVGAAAQEVNGDLYFLVGRIDQVPLIANNQPMVPASGLFNLNDQSTLWVAVTQRGLVITGENPGITNASNITAVDNVVYSRQLTQTGRNMGGGT